MLEQDYLTWSQQMKTLLKGERGEWAEPWLALCRQLDPDAWRMNSSWQRLHRPILIIFTAAKRQVFTLSSPVVLCCRGIWPAHPDYSFFRLLPT